MPSAKKFLREIGTKCNAIFRSVLDGRNATYHSLGYGITGKETDEEKARQAWQADMLSIILRHMLPFLLLIDQSLSLSHCHHVYDISAKNGLYQFLSLIPKIFFLLRH